MIQTEIERYIMQTIVQLDDALIKEAVQYVQPAYDTAQIVELALKEFVDNRKKKKLSDLKGKIDFAEEYDYKQMRARTT